MSALAGVELGLQIGAVVVLLAILAVLLLILGEQRGNGIKR
jgi:hypothetical protein